MTPPAGPGRSLVLLHGHGDDPDRLAAHAARLAPAGWDVHVPVGPVTLPDGRPAWFDDGSEADVRRLLAHLHAELDGRADAVVVGYSQGAAVGLVLAAAEGAPRVGAVAGVAGWLPTLEGVAWAPRPTVPVLLVHAADDEVVPLPMGRSAARFLERSGVPVTWHELDGDHALGAAAVAVVGDWVAGLSAASSG